tara:strand:- start:435 stop:665 length:231 start_codon:yes stop_codon:yes gene_type:complete
MKRTEKLINDTLNNLSKKQFKEIVDKTLARELNKLVGQRICGGYYSVIIEDTFSEEIKLDIADIVDAFLQKKGLEL